MSCVSLVLILIVGNTKYEHRKCGQHFENSDRTFYCNNYALSPINTDSNAISIISLKVNWRSSAVVCS